MRRFRVATVGVVVLVVASGVALWGSAASLPRAAVLDQASVAPTNPTSGLSCRVLARTSLAGRSTTSGARRASGVQPTSGSRLTQAEYRSAIERHLAAHRLLGGPPDGRLAGRLGGRFASLPGRSLVPPNGNIQRDGTGGRPGSSDQPVPIPGGLFNGAFHVWVPGPTELGFMGLNVEPNVITNFNGFAAVGFFVGTALGSDGVQYDMMDDMRVYRGTYLSADGTHHHGTFAFV